MTIEIAATIAKVSTTAVVFDRIGWRDQS